jgi:hypothetical protein
MTVLGVGSGSLGVEALYLLVIWLISTASAGWLSDRKGYGEKPGLAAGLLLSAVGVVIWLFWPARRNSRWRVQGWFRNTGGRTVAEARAEDHASDAP